MSYPPVFRKKNMKYYDPEYDQMVEEDYIRGQFSWFKKQKWFHKTYEQFKEDNFTAVPLFEKVTERLAALGYADADWRTAMDIAEMVPKHGNNIDKVVVDYCDR